VLTDIEYDFFRRADPAGFILFTRNCEHPVQVRDLVSALRDSVGRPDAPVLIDQEGGRVQRLGPPHWPAMAPGKAFAEMAEADMTGAVGAAELHGRLLAADLEALGITVNCAPVADILRPETHDVIGDRAFGTEPDRVGQLAAAVCRGLLAGGVTPVIKHLPGHGRARVDSHADLPVVATSREILSQTDFAVFRHIAQMPWAPMSWAMTAHIVYSAIDPSQPASTSKSVLRKIIRAHIGFGGILISDDIGMQALDGDMAERAKACLAAGCDLTLHCSGDLGEMEQAMDGTRRMRDIALHWLYRAEQGRREFHAKAMDKVSFDAAAARARLQAALAGVS